MTRKYGNVKWFNRLKGIGFISPKTGGTDVFVHYSALSGEGYKNLFQGDWVQFDEVDKGRGPLAVNVQRIEDTQSSVVATDWASNSWQIR